MASQAEIRSALFTRLNLLTDASWPTKWENQDFLPEEGVASNTRYQAVFLGFDRVDQRGPGDNAQRLIWGTLWIYLHVRVNKGTQAADARADLLINHFPRSWEIVGANTSGAVESAWAEMGFPDQDRKWFITPVKVRFFSF
jgi:hypothetical protein